MLDYLSVHTTEAVWNFRRAPQAPPLGDDIKRIGNDFETSRWDYACRTLHPDWPNPNMKQAPQVVPFYLTPSNNSSGNRTPVETWKSYIQALNGITNDDEQKWRFYTNDHSGYFNQTGWDKLESLGMGDNLVRVLDKDRGFSRIETLFLDARPDPELVNYERTPWLIHRFTVITPRNAVIDPPPGRIYSPVVVRRGVELWIPDNWLVNV